LQATTRTSTGGAAAAAACTSSAVQCQPLAFEKHTMLKSKQRITSGDKARAAAVQPDQQIKRTTYV
jgi:hypothetical protein